MKKTVIAAALASTVFSGAAMAWTAGGTGGNIEIGGNIQVTPYDTPWEVLVGPSQTGLNANITKGVTGVAIPVSKAIPVLGIRTVTKDAFKGGPGIAPCIDYKGAVDISAFKEGITTLSLPVMNADNPGMQIGNMSVKFSAAGKVSMKPTSGSYVANIYEAVSPEDSSYGFAGGVSRFTSGAAADAAVLVNSILPSATENFNTQGITTPSKPGQANMGLSDWYYSGYYGAGIPAGSEIKLTLTAPAANDVIKWKASMPITVSYQ